MNIRLFLLVSACAFFAACAFNRDSWLESVRLPLDTGSHVWWERTKGGY